MLFKLRQKVGSHVERDKDGKPRIYEAGDVIESDQDLVKLFVGKFDRVDRDTEGTAPYVAPNIPMPSKGANLEQFASLPQSDRTKVEPEKVEPESEEEDAALES